MGVRAYWAVVLAVVLGTQFWIAEQFEWVGRGKSRAVRAALGGSFHELKLRPNYWVDLDGGRAGREGDLRWAQDVRGRPLLLPSEGALIALAGNKAWEDIDAKYLAALPYSATSFPTGYESSPVRRGTVVAVRTVEGRHAESLAGMAPDARRGPHRLPRARLCRRHRGLPQRHRGRAPNG